MSFLKVLKAARSRPLCLLSTDAAYTPRRGGHIPQMS
jgi:hypothetical protein